MVQISAARTGIKIDSLALTRVEEALKAANITANAISMDGTSVKARFDSTDVQLSAKDVIQKALNTSFEKPRLRRGAQFALALARMVDGDACVTHVPGC